MKACILRTCCLLWLGYGLLGCGGGAMGPAEVVVATVTDAGDSIFRSISLNYRTEEMPERHYLILRKELSLPKMQDFLATESQVLRAKAVAAGIQSLGPPSHLFYSWEPEKGWGDAAVALPVAADVELPPYLTINLPATPALSLEFEGSHAALPALHYALGTELSRRSLHASKPSIEELLVGPADSVPVSNYRTRLIYPYSPRQ
ncbi:GyrI-like domain-containing protein [Neolewinella lacunae]|uniref:GyrI-like domain-containing protein n=1 Tax=Neolewinella lacunae TaxID=1517758 RepID=A0A923TCS9_9BACT|nr:GyrI-like domain-containing protein [Neolewinella lacunae]MBC6994062.1 GyrI-like domain-containing protein [Neolewinella lacunae]MDN3636067.1 GyrI-like domain-containing protein [Neolewinella lacunae]